MSPGRASPELVRRHLLALGQALDLLESHRSRPLGALTGNLEELWIIERGLQLCAQNALDIATHLAASAGHDAPQYAMAIDALSKLGVLPADFAGEFRRMAALRNILVHSYLGVDVAVLHQVLNERLDDFRRFTDFIEAYLERAP